MCIYEQAASASDHLMNLGVGQVGDALRVDDSTGLACKQLVPPAKQELARDELEPRREGVGRIFKHGDELRLVDVLVVTNLVGVGRNGHISRDEEDVINCERDGGYK